MDGIRSFSGGSGCLLSVRRVGEFRPGERHPPPPSSGRGRTWQRGPAGARVLAGGAEQAARPGRRLWLARLTGGEEERDEGATVGGSDLRAEVSTGKLRSEVHRLGKVKTQLRPSSPARVFHAARRVGAWRWLLYAAPHKSMGGAAGREDAGGHRLSPALCPKRKSCGPRRQLRGLLARTRPPLVLRCPVSWPAPAA